jgi:hypothetical protein
VQQDSPTILNGREVLTGFGSRKEGYYHRPKKWNPAYHKLDRLDMNMQPTYPELESSDIKVQPTYHGLDSLDINFLLHFKT